MRSNVLDIKKSLENLIEKHCLNQIFNKLFSFIEENVYSLDFTYKHTYIENVEFALLQDVEILRIENINSNVDKISFNLITNAQIEIGERVYGEKQSDLVNKWFTIVCSAKFDDKIDDFCIYNIYAYKN